MKNPIREYLLSPKEKKEQLLLFLQENPKQGFDSLFAYRGPYPEGADVIDIFPDLIYPVLLEIVQQSPSLLLTLDVKQMKSVEREVIYRLAADCQHEICTPLLLHAFQDRSVTAKQIAIEAVKTLPSLRTEEVKQILLHLETLGSLDFLKEEIKEGLALC